MKSSLACLFILTLGAYAHAQCFEASLGVLMPGGSPTAGLGDDNLFTLQPMTDGAGGGITSFPMGGVAASYTHAHVSTNGVIFLTNGAASGATTTGYSSSAATLIANLQGTAGQPPRIAAYWKDLNNLAANGGGVFFNNTIPGKFVVTWKNTVYFGSTSPVFTIQAQLFSSGEVRFFYSPTIALNSSAAIAGVSSGNAITAVPAVNLVPGPNSSSTQLMFETFLISPVTFDLAGQTVSFVPNGGGGYDESAAACVPANHAAYGIGCVPEMRSWYENFAAGAADLTGKTITATQNLIGGYDVSTGPLGTFNAPASIGLGLTDDSTVTIPLPFTFDYPGGSTGSITVDSNGRIHLAGAGLSDFSPTVPELLTSATATLCPAWQDELPDGALNVNNVFYDVISATEVDITWLNVPCFGGTGVTTMQVALIDNGTSDSVQFRYTQLQDSNSSGAIVGFSTGGASLNPGNRDLTAGSFSTQFPEGLGPLTLGAAPAPVLGASVTWTVSNVRVNASVSAIFFSFGQTVPVPLINLGLNSPGCFSLLNQGLGFGQFSSLLFTNPAATFAVTMPTGAIWAGADVYTQAVSLAPLDTPSGVISSNGLKSRLNTF
ncbi:MAG TPA: hypothetical protein VK348_05535 [Planctomycetota bacterium]|nr:hypothetical protein [Planctomycetota bacterium]